MKRKRIMQAILFAGLYIGLLCLLILFEKDQPVTFGQALWYSLATLTTVGYGDVVPKSVGGMAIGAVFVILSTFLLAFLIGVTLSFMRGNLLPLIRLALSEGKNWFIFEEYNTRSRIVGSNLQKEDSGSVVVFSDNPSGIYDRHSDAASEKNAVENFAGKGKAEVCTSLDTEAVIRRASDKKRCLVFCMDENGFRNYQRAVTLLDSGARVCCLSEYEPDRYPSSLIIYNPYVSCARQYWEKYQVSFSGETIVIIGQGKYAEAILEQALLVNVFHPDQQVRYLVFGDFREFRLNHPFLSRICTCRDLPEYKTLLQSTDSAEEENRGDILVFSEEPWNEDHEVLKKADRIILCFDDEEKTLSAFNTLHRYIPISASVYTRLSQYQYAGSMDTGACMISFGSPEELLTPENVLHRQLEDRGRILHEIYLKSNGKTSPCWEELSAFQRSSNTSSADHLLVKVRILLGGRAGKELTKEILEAAFIKWQEEWPENKDFFRRIEHERWMRFHLMNNWQYNEIRDDWKRLHTSIRPFDCLSEAEQVKDDYAWELIGKLACN